MFLDPHPILLWGPLEGRGYSRSQTDRQSRPSAGSQPPQQPGGPESASLWPKAGLVAATGANWRVAIGQHIVFHLRLQIPLRVSLLPLAGSCSHLEKREVCVGSGLPTGQPWLLPRGSALLPRSRDRVSGTLDCGLSEGSLWLWATSWMGHLGTGVQAAEAGCTMCSPRRLLAPLSLTLTVK